MKKILVALMVLSGCVTPEPRRPQTVEQTIICPKCQPCQREDVCDSCVRVCGDGGVRRCSRSMGIGEQNCECKS